MQSILRPYLTAGVALTGAGLIAVVPVAISDTTDVEEHAVALTAGPSDNAFTVDGTTFDPGSDGYNDFAPFVGVAPLLKVGFGSLGLGTNPSGTQPLEVYSDGSDLGAVHTSVNALGLLGFVDGAQFTVQSATPTAATVEAALTNSDLDLTGVNVDDLANAFIATSSFGPRIPYGDEITASDVQFALLNAGISLPPTSTLTYADIADVLSGVSIADLPDAGTVYSFTNLGGGFANVYEAVPSSDGSSGATITDTLVTPFGNINVPTSFDATVPIAPGDAFTDFAATSDDAGDNAFTLGGMTFDPGTDGFTPVSPLIGVAPLLAIGGGKVSLGGLDLPLAPQQMEVYSSDGTDLGSVDTTVNVQNLLGIASTQFAIADGTPAAGGSAADLPADGTVYSVTNLGSGWANVYIATPNAAGTAAGKITDTLVTPYGNMDIPTTFDAIAPMDAGAAFAGLGVASDVSQASDNAFTIADTTFDPGTDGFTPINPTAGIAPLLQIGGGSLAGLLNFATQDLDVYGSSGELGSVATAVNTSNLLGLIDTTQFTVDAYNDVPADDLVSALDNSDISFAGASFTASDLVTALENGNIVGVHLTGGDLTGADISGLLGTNIDLDAAGIDPNDVANVLNDAADAYGVANDLPELGTVYSVTNFGGGFENVYEAIPNADGTAASTITDYLVTPWGNVDLSSMFDAIAALDPGDAASGVSDVVGGAAAGAFDLFDPGTWF